jgi:hypothetical protein
MHVCNISAVIVLFALKKQLYTLIKLIFKKTKC